MRVCENVRELVCVMSACYVCTCVWGCGVLGVSVYAVCVHVFVCMCVYAYMCVYVCVCVCVCLCVCVWFYTSSLASQVALASTGYFDADIYSQSDKFAGYLTSIAPNDGDEVCY